MKYVLVFILIFFISCIKEPKKNNQLKKVIQKNVSETNIIKNRDRVTKSIHKERLIDLTSESKANVTLSDLKMLFTASNDYFEQWCLKNKMIPTENINNQEQIIISYKNEFFEITKGINLDDNSKRAIIFSLFNEKKRYKFLEQCFEKGYKVEYMIDENGEKDGFYFIDGNFRYLYKGSTIAIRYIE